MTNLLRVDKRERLIAAAMELFYNQGVHRTTLADIAAAADVPLGNVYYYFKTRDDLVDAVVEQRGNEIRDALGRLDQRRTAKARLKGLAEMWTEQADLIVESGCPLGGLSYELSKSHDEVAGHARVLLGTILDWAEHQFREMGRRDARSLSLQLIGAIQGAVLLSNALGDVALLRAEIRRLERWIDSVG
jgi:TetR/AcrR family transcriptional regulator, transcriptional repressor for nem operon